MSSPPAYNPNRTSDLIAEITDTLTACGLDEGDYQLLDSVDVEALAQLRASASEELAVRFTVEGVRLVVTADEVNVLVGE